jgi:hypothetical protein
MLAKLISKEIKLAASPLSYAFVLFALLAFVPGYPILVGVFFACLGIFQSFQVAREANDITYTALLPVAKSDVVWAKFAFCLLIELAYFVLTAVCTLIRMALLPNVPVYVQNALMGSNLVYLGYVLLLFGLFNVMFVRGFFKTAYKFGRPFLAYAIVAFCVVALSEILYRIPALTVLNTLRFSNLGAQLTALCLGAILFVALTAFAIKSSIKRFEKIDL